MHGHAIVGQLLFVHQFDELRKSVVQGIIRDKFNSLLDSLGYLVRMIYLINSQLVINILERTILHALHLGELEAYWWSHLLLLHNVVKWLLRLHSLHELVVVHHALRELLAVEIGVLHQHLHRVHVIHSLVLEAHLRWHHHVAELAIHVHVHVHWGRHSLWLRRHVAAHLLWTTHAAAIASIS